MSAQPMQFFQEIELPATAKPDACTAKLAVRFCPVSLRSPRRLDHPESFKVYAVYAQEVDPPEAQAAVCWMLLTTEAVTSVAQAETILRWYRYRWHVEAYHKVLKSGCKVEDYRLAATSMEALLGFLTVIAAELLRLTYLHPTQPDTPAHQLLRPVQLSVLKAKAPQLPKVLTVAWALQTVAWRLRLPATSAQNSDWHSSSLARMA